MPHNLVCEELNRIKLEAIAALHSARKTRRARDLSFHEDVELTRDEHEKIDALLKHLLAGHEGLPCPAGERPIIGISRPMPREALAGHHGQSAAQAAAVGRRRH